MGERLSAILIVGLFAASMFVSGLRGGESCCSTSYEALAVAAMAVDADEASAPAMRSCCNPVVAPSGAHQTANQAPDERDGEKPHNCPCSGDCDCMHCHCTVSMPVIDTSSQPQQFELPANDCELLTDRLVPMEHDSQLLRPPQS